MKDELGRTETQNNHERLNDWARLHFPIALHGRDPNFLFGIDPELHLARVAELYASAIAIAYISIIPTMIAGERRPLENIDIDVLLKRIASKMIEDGVHRHRSPLNLFSEIGNRLWSTGYKLAQTST